MLLKPRLRTIVTGCMVSVPLCNVISELDPCFSAADEPNYFYGVKLQSSGATPAGDVGNAALKAGISGINLRWHCVLVNLKSNGSLLLGL